MNPEFTNEEGAALATHPREAIDRDPYPLAPRLDPLKAILAKLEGRAVKVSILALAFSFLFVLPVVAIETTTKRGHCLLEIDGKSYLKGNCRIDLLDNPRDPYITQSFSIGSDQPYWAMVNINPQGVATGSWNAEKGSSHAQADLGTLATLGPTCWANEHAKICVTAIEPTAPPIADPYAALLRCLYANPDLNNPVPGCSAQWDAFLTQCTKDNWGMPSPIFTCKSLGTNTVLQVVKERLLSGER